MSELPTPVDDIATLRDIAEEWDAMSGRHTRHEAGAAAERIIARIAELEAKNARLWAVIGSVAEHDRVFGAHIAAAMKEFDLCHHAEEGSKT